LHLGRGQKGGHTFKGHQTKESRKSEPLARWAV
jgi:hypothetical protein